MPFKKILKFWNVSEDDQRVPCNLKLMDVTNFGCEEDNDSLQVLDSGGAVIAEFGPGKQYESWALTVEYPTLQQLSSLSLAIMKSTQIVYAPVKPLAAGVNTSPVRRPAVETGFTLVSRSGRG